MFFALGLLPIIFTGQAGCSIASVPSVAVGEASKNFNVLLNRRLKLLLFCTEKHHLITVWNPGLAVNGEEFIMLSPQGTFKIKPWLTQFLFLMQL